MHFFTSQLSEYFFLTLRWLFSNSLEVLATITGLIYLVYSVQGKTLLWFFGIITSGLYIYVFFHYGIYADMGINIYYVVISIYGWYHWKYGSASEQNSLQISRLNLRTGIYLLLISLAIFLFIALVLDKFTNSNIALWDAFTTAFSITATWMLARKIIEHWLVWIVVDLVSTGLYIYKGLYPTVLLFIVYTILAFIGYKVWFKEWEGQKQVR